jgi:glycosyltransferase involved in cell wall biosynthesis
MKTSAIMVTKNRESELKNCVESLVNQTRTIDELVIVDASDNPKTGEYAKSLKGNIAIRTIYINQTQGGMDVARNMGVEKSTGDIVLFLDDDVILNKEYNQEIYKVFAADANKL